MFFEKRIDRRSRKALTEFLSGHDRYDTMNSWNRSTSYANCIKINRLGLDPEAANKAYEILETDFWPSIEHPIDEFTEKHHDAYTMGRNGRSSGYLVLYQSRRESTEYKSFCRTCGQRNFKNVVSLAEGTKTELQDAPLDNRCGRCGAEGAKGRINFAESPTRIAVYPGRPLDQDEDFSTWSMSALRNRTGLITAFDRACDVVRDAFVHLIDDYYVVEKTVLVPKTIKVLQSAVE